MNRIAVLGVGRVGSAIARAALAVGYEVTVAASGPAEEIALLAEIVIPGARARDAADAVADADVVILAIPLHKYRTLDPALFADRIVVDAMNYWEPVDGEITEFRDASLGSSEIVARHLDAARVVKTLNHIGYHDLEEHAGPAGSPARRALGVAGDDRPAVEAVMAMIDRLGFDPVDAGPLRNGAALEPGTAIFTGVLTRDAVAEALGSALAI